jgi:hypothetical protein
MTDRTAVYPGTFDPPTIAHLHIARTAIAQLGLGRIDLTISSLTLGKDDGRLSPIDDRLTELDELVASDTTISVRSTAASLIVDIAEGYDVIVVGADKWSQVIDPVWYGGVAERDEALLRLPLVALAPRPPWPIPAPGSATMPPDGVEFVVLDIDPLHHEVSATAVRAGRDEWRARPLER